MEEPLEPLNDESMKKFVATATKFFEDEMPEMRRKVNEVHAAVYGGLPGSERPLVYRVEDLENKTNKIDDLVQKNSVALKEDIRIISDERKKEIPDKVLTKNKIDMIWKVFQAIMLASILLYLGLK